MALFLSHSKQEFYVDYVFWTNDNKMHNLENKILVYEKVKLNCSKKEWSMLEVLKPTRTICHLLDNPTLEKSNLFE